MDIKDAQRDMTLAYVLGAPGIFVSGVVWLVAATVWWRLGLNTGFAALFVGGMAIMPGSVLLARLVFRAPKATPGNPLERLALESTFLLFAGLFIAWRLLTVAPDLAFPVVAIAIGARYFVFRTLYDDAVYWLLGGLLLLAGGLAALRPQLLPGNIAFAVAALELGFATVMLARRRRIG